MQLIGKLIVLFVGAVVVLGTIGKCSEDKEAKRRAQIAADRQKEFECNNWRSQVNIHIDNGLFANHSSDWKEVQIDSTMWNRITADNKKTIINNTAKCMSDGKITFKDRISGKVLGDRGYLSTATLY